MPKLFLVFAAGWFGLAQISGITLSTRRYFADVVIYEVNWQDQWLKLKNNTGHEIDLSNWQIAGAVAGRGGHFEIPARQIIPADGYYLVDKPNLKLHESLVLKNKDKEIVDRAPDLNGVVIDDYCVQRDGDKWINIICW